MDMSKIKKMKKSELIEFIEKFAYKFEVSDEEETDLICPICGKTLLTNQEDIYCPDSDNHYSHEIWNVAYTSISDEIDHMKRY